MKTVPILIKEFVDGDGIAKKKGRIQFISIATLVGIWLNSLMKEDNIKQMISWYLNTSDPGAASDYLDELINFTTDQSYEFIIKEIISAKGYSLVALMLYLEEITTPDRKKILIYLDQIDPAAFNSSYLNLYLKLKRILN